MPAHNDVGQLNRRPFKRLFGGYVVIIFFAVTTGLVLTFGPGWVQPGIKKFAIVHRAKYKRAPGPLSTLSQGRLPRSSQQHLLPRRKSVKAVEIFGSYIKLKAGGETVKQIPLASSSNTLEAVTKLVNRPGWIQRNGRTIIIKSGIVANSGATLNVGSPQISRVVFADDDSVLLGSEHGGKLDISGVSVTSDAKPHPANHLIYRPSIVASNKGVLDVHNSHISDLGWDWNAGYGIAWVNGSTGEAVNSTFDDSFIGAYTSNVSGIKFIRDTFEHNDLYGLDPHTHSHNLLVDHDLAQYNAAHGIIFSQFVTNSIVEYSISRDNGENGIMMDLGSTHNVIRYDKVYGNQGDGIVTSTSSHVVVSHNVDYNNRVGLRVSPAGGVSASNNRIFNNRLAAEGIALNGTNHVTGNGGQLRYNVVVRIWAWDGAITLLVLVVIFAGYALWRRTLTPELA